jgi:UDP-glucose 4-epimerase
LDNLVYGHRESVKWGHFINADLSDAVQLREVFQAYRITAVVHFAAYTYVGESVTHPQKYYENNVVSTLRLLEMMREFDVKHMVFSSTCATYGVPMQLPIPETHSQNPINPYGRSKLMIEQILKDFSHAYGMTFVALRYFNAAGADPDGELGEWHVPESHLIPLAARAVFDPGFRLQVFGSDYDTPDGTCVRDYIHVVDLADAHIRALRYLIDGGASTAFNLGNGKGYSVMEVIRAVEKHCGLPVIYDVATRREGDPPVLVGDATRAQSVLEWHQRFADLDTIVGSALAWHRAHPQTIGLD